MWGNIDLGYLFILLGAEILLADLYYYLNVGISKISMALIMP